MNRPPPGETCTARIASPLSQTEAPHIIHPAAVYTVDDLRRNLGLKASSVRREVRLGRLRMAKRCGRYYCLGRWVREWIESGEVKKTPRLEGAEGGIQGRR